MNRNLQVLKQFVRSFSKKKKTSLVDEIKLTDLRRAGSSELSEVVVSVQGCFNFGVEPNGGPSNVKHWMSSCACAPVVADVSPSERFTALGPNFAM